MKLHFADPQAYHDIYNSQNRWDKEYHLYHSFGEDRSSFGYLTYTEAKDRKDVLNKKLSARSIGQAEPLVQEKVLASLPTLLRIQTFNESRSMHYAQLSGDLRQTRSQPTSLGRFAQ